MSQSLLKILMKVFSVHMRLLISCACMQTSLCAKTNPCICMGISKVKVLAQILAAVGQCVTKFCHVPLTT